MNGVGVVVAVTGDKEVKVALISDILRVKEKLKQQRGRQMTERLDFDRRFFSNRKQTKETN